MYARIKQVVEVSKFLAAKDQQGFININEINSGVASMIQLQVLQSILDAIEKTPGKRITGRINAMTGFHSADRLIEMIQPLEKVVDLTALGSNPWPSPSDVFLRQPDGLTINGIPVEALSKRECTMLNRLKDKPTVAGPIAYMDATSIGVFPINNSAGKTWITTAELSYWKVPQGSVSGVASTSSPRYGIDSSTGTALYDASNSVDFELGIQTEEMLIFALLGYCGIHLREEEVQNWANTEEGKQIQQTL